MNPNHLFIGLGGTGGKIIRALRKTIFQEFRKEHPDGVNIAYLYVDSSTDLMDLNDPSWKLLGTSVQLGENSKLVIKGANLASILDNINNFPNIKPWIGDRAQWDDILNGIVGDAVGGQKRRLGRFLFANHARKFCEMVTTQVRELQTGGQTKVTFHIVCGLAGGTGSGTLIDTIAQIRKLYPNSNDFRTLVYVFLPEEHPKPNWNTGNYHANGYAALLDLNAFSIGQLAPHDIAADGHRLTSLQTPFNGCYLFTNKNENGLTVDTEADLPNVVADFLYQKIVTVRQVDWTSLGRAENAENGDGNPELLPGGTTGVRTKRALAFGVKRVAIPEEEITEYLSYSFARQAALQLRYNNWSDGQGYVPLARNLDHGDYARQKEQLERWLISDEHLILSSGILESDSTTSRWQPINKYWATSISAFKEVVEQEPSDGWLTRLMNKVEQRYAEQYRGLGVKSFYKGMHNARRERAREIRGRIEKEFFADWKNGTRSIQEIADLTAAIVVDLQERFERADEQIVKMKDKEAEAQRRVTEQQAEWAKMGSIARMTGKPKQIFSASALLLQELYIYRTRLEGWLFAKQFLPEILEELTDLKANLDRSASMVSEAIKQFDEGIHARCNDGPEAHDLRRQVIRFYDSDHVKAVTRRLLKDDREQTTQTQQVRSVLAERLGDRLDFKTFNERTPKTVFLDTLEKQCLENVKISHNNLLQNTKDKLLGVSILEKLRERYADRQELRRFVDQIVKAAGNYLVFDQQEKNRSASGINKAAQMCVSNFSIVIPKAPEESEFIAELKEAFKTCSQVPVDFVEKEGGKNEITLVSITNLFPFRVVDQVRFLRDKYKDRVAGSGGPRAKLELHLDADGSDQPNLFVPSDKELVDAGIPYLLLASALGILETGTGKSGKPELFISKGEGFEKEQIFLGKDLNEALSQLTLETVQLIKERVAKELADGSYQQAAQREPIEKTMYAQVEAIQKDGIAAHQTVKRLMDGGKVALRIIRGQE